MRTKRHESVAARRWSALCFMPFMVASSIVALVLVVVTLAGMTFDRSPTAAAGRANIRELWPFWMASALAWATLSGLWWTSRGAGSADAIAAPRGAAAGFRRAALIVLAVAALARGAVLVTHEPALSDDVYRYVFDGRNSAAGINPYLVIPETRRRRGATTLREAESWVGEQRLIALMNNAEMSTIYLPTSQWVFAGCGRLAAAWSSPRSQTRLFRGVFVVVELLGIGLVLLMLRWRQRPAWWAALYAWHPLPLAEIAGSGHQDALGVTLLLAALALHARRPASVHGWTGTLAAAALVKPIAVVAAPLLLRGRRWTVWLTSLVTGAAVCLAVGLPWLLTGGGEAIANLGATTGRFGLKWAHFGSIYEPMLTVIEWLTPAWTNDPQEQLARAICLGLLVVVVVWVWWRGRSPSSDLAAIVLAMVLLSPAVHPWYLLWALALFPLAPSPAVWIASLTIPWGYAALGDPEGWTVPWWLMAVAYAPIYAAIAVALVRRRRA